MWSQRLCLNYFRDDFPDLAVIPKDFYACLTNSISVPHETGSVTYKKGAGMPTVRTEELVNDVRQRMEQEATTPLKRLPQEIGLSYGTCRTTVWIVSKTVGNLVRYKHYLIRRVLNFILKEKRVKLAVTKTVAEFIFDGYDDPMLDLAIKLNISSFHVPYTKFGWFVDRNGSAEYDGVYNMYTGEDNIEKLGILNTWNYMNRVSYLKGNCSKVDGTTGELWYPPNDVDSITLFASDLCSSIELKRNDEYTIHGIEGHKYLATEEVFDNGTLYPKMSCFVPDNVQRMPSGVRNVSECKLGAPALVSYSNFYLADPSYREAITGMQPDKEKHQMFIVLEPVTGIPLRVNAIFQINLQMDPIEGIDILTNINSTLMPAFWFKQTVEITQDLANEAKLLLVLPSAVTYTGYGILAIGILLIVIGGFITYKRAWRGSEEEQLLNQPSS